MVGIRTGMTNALHERVGQSHVPQACNTHVQLSNRCGLSYDRTVLWLERRGALQIGNVAGLSGVCGDVSLPPLYRNKNSKQSS